MCTLFKAVPWGAPLPALQFDQLGAQPSFIHTLLGDRMWKECWGTRHGEITGAHYVPYKMLNIVKWTAEKLNLQLSPEELEWGQTRYGETQRAAAERRKDGSPY